MHVNISHQKATALAKKFFDSKLPPKTDGDGYCLPTGAKLRWSSYSGWHIMCYTYNPAKLELAPLNIKVQNNE
jgi:hypothetical protein